MNYSQSILKTLPSFILSRFISLGGISLVFVLVAHKTPEHLALFSYVVALLSVISTVLPLFLATAGNEAASLMAKPADLHSFFSGGFTLSLLIGTLTAIVCTLSVQLATETSGVQQWDREAFWSLSALYILATPLIATNTFLYLFYESTGKANWVASIKLKTTLGCSGFLAGSFLLSNAENFKFYAMIYFPLIELSTLFFLTSTPYQRRLFSIRNAKKIFEPLLRKGVPIAVGMSGQKIYFYLLMERLLRIDNTLPSALSVFMTVAGLSLVLPAALTQLHSFQVSRHLDLSKGFYRTGLIWMAGLLLATTVFFSVTGPFIFYIVGGEVTHYNVPLFFTLIAFIFSNSFLSLAVAHLRARGETLLPQLVINIIMLGLLTPLLYSLEPSRFRVEIFLMLQSAATALGFLLLGVRIAHIHRGER